MACGTPRTLTWCVSARALANVTSQSTHRGPSLVDARRDVKRDREETPGSVALPPLVLPCEDDEGSGSGMTRTEELPRVHDIPTRRPFARRRGARDEVQAKTRWTHT